MKNNLLLLIFAFIVLTSLTYAAPCGSIITGCCDIGAGNTNQIFTLNSSYTSSSVGYCHTITRSNVTFDCQGYEINTLQSSGEYSGILISGATNTTVKNCKITNFLRGIRAYNSINVTISNNTINGYTSSTNPGITSSSSTGTLIINNYIKQESGPGIGLQDESTSIN
jgi:parallel beta-helix repeat protein